jgi:ketosteroid isomerase-like protein
MQMRAFTVQPCCDLAAGSSSFCERLRLRYVSILVILCAAVGGTAVGTPFWSKREQITKLVVQIQRADYEGDRETLKRLYQELAPFADDQELGASVRYWRGFAMWRRALNGFNESVDPHDSEQDLKQAVSEFEAAIAKDPAFVDARASAGATRGLLMAMYNRNPELAPEFKDPARKHQAISKALSYMNEAKAAEPENPRVWWVLGPVQWYLAHQRGDGPDKASDAVIETFQKGLMAARARKSSVRDPLIPTWGEPELLMSLAATNFYRPTPDLAMAEQHTRSALALVPYWHYVRDILLPSIETAKVKAELVAMERAALDRWNKGDPNGYLEIMSPNVTYYDPTREKRVDGLAAVKEYVIPAMERIRPAVEKIRVDHYEMINPQVQRVGDVAILTFNLINILKQADSEKELSVRWNSTEVYRLIDGKWKIIHSHWSYTKPELK